VGTSLSLAFSQIVAWDLSFIAPVFTLLVLSTPMPVMKPKAAIGFVVVLTVALMLGLSLLPPLQNQPLAGILLLALMLYWSFYFTAKGGAAVLGTLATVGIAVSTAVGSVNIDAVIMIVQQVILGAVAGIVFVWVAHALFPDAKASNGAMQDPAAGKEKAEPDLAAARWSAFRSLAIVLPIALWFLFSSSSAGYVAVMIKVATMGQQAGTTETRAAARSLLLSTVIGGVGAIIGWQVLSVAPTLPIYTLFIALTALVFGPRIFEGRGLHRHAATWSYGFLTMLVILAPAVLDGLAGAPAGAKFWDRLLMFAFATVYAVAAVYIFDALTARRLKLHNA
jgi:hypothetical protein